MVQGSSDILRAASSTRGKVDLLLKQASRIGGDFDTKKQAALIELLDNYQIKPLDIIDDIPRATILKTVPKTTTETIKDTATKVASKTDDLISQAKKFGKTKK